MKIALLPTRDSAKDCAERACSGAERPGALRQPSDELGYGFTNTMVPVIWFPETQYASPVSTPAADVVSTLFALASLPVVGGASATITNPPVY
jgi:hypothetical protein